MNRGEASLSLPELVNTTMFRPCSRRSRQSIVATVVST
jgi:hypothetical protein